MHTNATILAEAPRLHDRRPLEPQAISVASRTGPLGLIENKRVLVILDVENLTYGARDLGLKVSYRRLGEQLKRTAQGFSLHAFYSRKRGEEGRCHYFRECGWIPHPRDIETVRTCHGTHVRGNSDNMILFGAGHLVSRSAADVVIIGTGDGDLACDLASAIAALPKPRAVASLSLAGSTSWRINAAKNGDINVNIELGRDCLRPLG